MCGIVAAFAYHADAPPIAEGEMLRIRDGMAARGPDAAGSWMAADGRVAMGHRRLAIIDLSPGGNQPMTLETSGTCITFNGEIYNYRELRRELEARGRIFRTESDTEVILHGYEEFGRGLLERLRGMYAFALWDPRRRGLFLARDPCGIKPLYYADDGRTIFAASQVKALRSSGRLGRRLSAAGQVSFLLWGFIQEPHTLYADIRCLPAGSSLWIDAAGTEEPRSFWSVAKALGAAETNGAARPMPPAERHQRLHEALAESVRYHMIADVPVGLFLSGGLDSGTLLSLAAEQAEGRMRALTLGFEEFRGTAADEVIAASESADHSQAAHEIRWISSRNFTRDRSRLVAAMDQPTIDGVNVYFVSQMAAEAGLKVALSGLGADELFAGYPSFRQIPRIVRRLGPLAPFPAVGRALRLVSAPLLRHMTSPKYAGILEYGSQIEDAYFLRRGLFMPWELPLLLGPDIAREGWEAVGLNGALRQQTGNLRSTRARITALEMGIYMRNQLLRDSDWAGMAHSLEIRVPFVDAQLIERLAPLLVGSDPPSKHDMACAPARPLPPDLQSRVKTGFAVPMRSWMIQDLPTAGSIERGLRGWARYILREQLAA